MLEPEDHALDTNKVLDLINKLWNLETHDSLKGATFPEIDMVNYTELTFSNGEKRDLQIGSLNYSKGMYPVLVPQENIQTWVPKHSLEPLLKNS